MANEGDRQLYGKEAEATLRALRQHVRWKPGKDTSHLDKRKLLGHLSAEATIEDYNGIISALLNAEEHSVYLYAFGAERYYAVSGSVGGKDWLVIATKAGIVETAFPPYALEEYLRKRGFVFLGTMQEVLT